VTPEHDALRAAVIALRDDMLTAPQPRGTLRNRVINACDRMLNPSPEIAPECHTECQHGVCDVPKSSLGCGGCCACLGGCYLAHESRDQKS
jgi:hypothetical protein